MCVKDSGEDRWMPSGQVAILPFSVKDFSFPTVGQYMAEHGWIGDGWALLKGRKLLSECLQFFGKWVTKNNSLVVFDTRKNPLVVKRDDAGNIVIEKTNDIPEHAWTVLFKKRQSKQVYNSRA